MSTSSFRRGGGWGGVVAVGEVSHGDMLPPVVRLLKKTIVSSLLWGLAQACGGGRVIG